MNGRRSQYIKGSSEYKYVHKWIDIRGKETFTAMIDGTTRPFDTERLAAIFVDKHLIGLGKEPVNIFKRK